ncbi:MAG: hypothetical protein V7713_14285 [Marinobacter sp.]
MDEAHFEVHIHEGDAAEDYADAQVRVSELIQRASGARGTELHSDIRIFPYAPPIPKHV